jgi:hypothetical protein
VVCLPATKFASLFACVSQVKVRCTPQAALHLLVMPAWNIWCIDAVQVAPGASGVPYQRYSMTVPTFLPLRHRRVT